MKKRVLSLILAVIVIFGVVPMNIFAAEQKAGYTDSVPDDWQNDLWLQYDHKELEIGESIDIFPRRVPQIIDNWANNNVVRPNFNFEIIEGDSIDLSNNDGNDTQVTAVKEGTSIVKVTYDAVLEHGASSVVNTAYAVFTVAEQGESDINVGEELLKLTSYDTLYYTGDGYELSFSASTSDGKILQVTCNGEEIEGKNGIYTAKLKNRSNIIGIVSTDSNNQTKSYYKVVDARKIEVIVENETNPGFAPAALDTIKISFKGITMPIYKLAAIYNPCFNSVYENTSAAYLSYSNDILGEFKGQSSQWDLATNNSFTVVFPTEGTYTFKGDQIKGDVFAKEIGYDKITQQTGGTDIGHIYSALSYSLSALPDFDIYIAQTSGAVKVEGIEMLNSTAQVQREQSFTEDEINELIGLEISPQNASNKKVTWSTSDGYVFSVRDGFKANSAGSATLTATTVDGGFSKSVKVLVVDIPATQSDKDNLISKISQALKIAKVDGVDEAWLTLTEEIEKSNQLLVKEDLTDIEVEDAIKALDREISAYEKAVEELVTFKYEVSKQKIDGKTQITINFPNLPVNVGTSTTTSIKLKYQTNIENLDILESEEAKDDKTLLKTLVFAIEDGFSGEIKLTDGHISDRYFRPQPPSGYRTTTYYQGQMPDITLKISSDGNVVEPPKPQASSATLSIDKLTIDKGYVIKSEKANFSAGESVWDVTKRALDQNKIPYQFSFNEQYGSVYISSIAGDGEFDHGPGSGWKYSVNGVYPNKGASAYKLSDGDVIKWRYTTNLGADLEDSGDAESDKTVIPDVSVSDKTASVKIKEDDIKDAIASAVESKQSSITIEVKTSKDINKVELTMPVSSIKKISNDSSLNMVIDSPVGILGFSNDLLQNISSQAISTDIKFVIEKTDIQIKEALGIDLNDAVATSVKIIAGDKNISDFSGHTLSITVPVLEKFIDKTTYKALILSGDDSVELTTASVKTDKNMRLATMKTTHLSTFVVSKEITSKYNDVLVSDWYFNAVEKSYYQGIMNGVSENRFNPNQTMTREMVAQVLYNLSSAEKSLSENKLSDVLENMWYTDAVLWASENKIMNGYGTNVFGINDSVTREQMATILMNFAAFEGRDISKKAELDNFKDKNSISSWAKESMKWANQEQIITGKSESTLDPKGFATRAEVATIMMNYTK